MHQPSPWLLLIGGVSLLNVSVMVAGLRAPDWARFGGMGLCIALGLTAIGLALARYFRKKPERPRIALKRTKTERRPP